MKIGPVQEAWLQELERGSRQQCTNVLRSAHDEFCCLGVFADMFAPSAWNEIIVVEGTETPWEHSEGSGALGENEVEALGLYTARGGRAGCGDEYEGSLACLNDEGYSFEEIAKVVRNAPDQFFKEPK